MQKGQKCGVEKVGVGQQNIIECDGMSQCDEM